MRLTKWRSRGCSKEALYRLRILVQGWREAGGGVCCDVPRTGRGEGKTVLGLFDMPLVERRGHGQSVTAARRVCGQGTGSRAVFQSVFEIHRRAQVMISATALAFAGPSTCHCPAISALSPSAHLERAMVCTAFAVHTCSPRLPKIYSSSSFRTRTWSD